MKGKPNTARALQAMDTLVRFCESHEHCEGCPFSFDGSWSEYECVFRDSYPTEWKECYDRHIENVNAGGK